MIKPFVKRNKYRGVFIVFVLVCFVMGIFSFQYYRQLQSTIRGESNGYLQEISRRIGSNVDQIINDNFSVLNSLSSFLDTADADTFSDVQAVVSTQRKHWNYLDILLIDEDGNASNSEGKQVTLNNNTYFEDSVMKGEQSLSTTQMINNQECIMLAVPLNNIQIDGKNMVALAASYDPTSFNQTLSMSSFDGQAYSCIISKSGTLIVRSSSSSSLKMGYNVLNALSESSLDSGRDIDSIRKDINSDVAGQVGFLQDSERYYMIYTPINPDDWYLLTFVPANVVNEKSDMILKTTLLLCGLITALFAGLIAFIIFNFYRNKRGLEHIAYVDEVTEGNTIQKFYELANEALKSQSSSQYALIYTNLCKFKVLNEQFGRSACDNILKMFYQNINSSLQNKECVGRISADNFCILLEYSDESDLIHKFQEWCLNAEKFVNDNNPAWSLPITEFGIYIVGDDTIPFPLMIDRAKLALRESRHAISNKLHYGIYDDEVRRQLFREKHLEDMMEPALNANEFQVYLQPKYRVSDKKIGGAEALARWNSPTEGMIFPDEFIPLFEKNGFVVQLDLWVFEEICRKLREWIDKGQNPVKISVNCSRVHLKNNDFLNDYYTIVQRYNVPPELIEIELTEGLVMEEAQSLTKTIDNIHSYGFGCSMDDFGSGYSSLNLIQEIPVDTLKLDKIFFRSNVKDSSRMESVVGSIITMAKALSMSTVAEGVEYPEQVHMLEKIGCDLIQGYVFAKPMPISDFEELAFGTEEK